MSLNEIRSNIISKLIDQGFKSSRDRHGFKHLMYKDFVFENVILKRRWFKNILCVYIEGDSNVDASALTDTINSYGKMWCVCRWNEYNWDWYQIYIPIECADKTVQVIDLYYTKKEDNCNLS